MLIDPRGPRFVAALTTVVLGLVLLTANVWLLALQSVIFAWGALAGVQRTPYAALFRRLIRPRLGPPADLESAAPPRFAQGVGFVFALVGVIALAFDATAVALVAVGLAFGAAFLNAAFGFCLGCEIYLLAKRATTRRPQASTTTPTEINKGTTTPEEITA
jgi:hypothetical protein